MAKLEGKMKTNKIRGMELKLGTRVEVMGTEVSEWICWHNATVIKVRHRKHLIHVKYDEKHDEGENIEEHVDYDRVRPIAPILSLESCAPGTLVEARTCGWWTGKIKKVNSSKGKYKVRFPQAPAGGPGREYFEKINIRVPQDWFVAPHKNKYAWHIKDEILPGISDTTDSLLITWEGTKERTTTSHSELQSESSSLRMQQLDETDSNPTLAVLSKEVRAEAPATHPPDHHKKIPIRKTSPQIRKVSRMKQPSTHQLQITAYGDLLQVLMAKYKTGIRSHVRDLLSRCCQELQINLTEHGDLIQQHLERQQFKA